MKRVQIKDVPIFGQQYEIGTSLLWWMKIAERYPQYFDDKVRVLELGSAEIKPGKRKAGVLCSGAYASTRELFSDKVKEYVGVDYRSGGYTDVVCFAHEYKSNKRFDVVCSMSMLGHDVHWEESIKNACALLKKQGVLILSWGAARSASFSFFCSPGTYSLKAGLVLEQLKKEGLYVHELQYVSNLPWWKITNHTNVKGGEVVLIAFKNEKNAIGEQIIDELLDEDLP